jgi:hypothetical protein
MDSLRIIDRFAARRDAFGLCALSTQLKIWHLSSRICFLFVT